MKRLLLFFLVFLLLARVPLITGCANMIPPSGGPKDTLPPVLLMANPVERALNVNSYKIVLNFDEYIDLKDIRTNLLVSPVPKVAPTITSHLRTITITLKDTLQPKTTYALNFGKAITDVNEGNVLRNFTYAFSTGNYLDSLRYSGRLIMANTGKPDSTLIVMLHYQLFDSAVAKLRPRYIARLDSSGNFTFTHVKPDIYALYALKDESGTHQYTTKAQTFAFADSPVDLRRSTTPLLLYAYQDASDYKKPKKAAPPPPLSKKEEKEKIKRLLISGNIPSGLLDLHNQFELSFATPIKYYDSAKIRFTNDSFQNISTYHFMLDSTNKKESDYGNLRLRFKNLDLTRHPVLLFLQGEKIVLSYTIGRSLRYNYKLFEPGDYEIRILYDRNQNGVWDPGDFYKHLQPEIVVPIRKKLSVKSDWDNEVDISL